MTKFLISLILISASIVVPAFSGLAQTKVSGPEYFGVWEATIDGKNSPLERQSSVMVRKSKAFGMGGVELFWKFSGPRSPVRFRAGQSISFIVRVVSTDLDPANSYFLNRVASKGKERRAVVASSGISGKVTSDMTNSDGRVQVVYRKQGKDFFRLEPLTPLPPGEYMLFSGAPSNAFLFGID